MRMIFSLIGLLIVVAIVGFLAKSQLSAVSQLPSATSVNSNATTAPANIAEQSKQMQSQVKDQVNEAMKAAAEAQQKAAAEAQQKALDSANADKPVDKTGSAY